MNCIFCKVLNGELPCNKVFENDNFVAILDAFPANEGHTLVIPKKHYKNIFEINEETLKECYAVAKKVAEAIRKALNIEDINILQNNGAIAGQTVNHFHIHIIPRNNMDNISILFGSSNYNTNMQKEITEKIKSNLN